MFDNILKKLINKRKLDNSELTPSEEENKANALSKKAQKYTSALKPKKETTVLLVDRNRWFITTLLLAIILLVCVTGWYRAEERFANHVRVAFVKLDPSGSYSISFYDDNDKPTFFKNTINSLLTTYVERRFSKNPYTISADYGYVLNFMSAQLRNSFLQNYNAAKVAADFETCKTCQQIKVTVRAIQHEESDRTILDGKPGTIYRSTVFARATELNPDGTVVSRANEIITLTWTLQNIGSLPNNLSAIQADPIGIEILAESLKADPTPVTN